MNFSAYSIKNPLVAILLFTLLTIGGVIAFKDTKIQQFPDIDMPAVITTVTMNGVSPAQLENDVAKKIENRLASIEGIKHIRTTINTGVVSIHSEFSLEKKVQEAVDDVRSAVGEVRSNLPATADEPIIQKVSTAGFAVVGYSVSSPSMDDKQLSWWVDDTLSKQLSDLQGVGKITRIGGIERQIIVKAHPDKLNGWQLPITSLANQIASLWQDASGGATKIGGGHQTVRIVGTSPTLDDLKQLDISTPTGTSLLNQIADIEDSHADIQSLAYLDRNPVVAFTVTRSRGASEVSMVNLIEQKIADIQHQNPNIHIHKIYDNAEPIFEDYKASLQMLIEGCILAVIVVFVFLRNWRATLISAAALPLSIIPTFLAMYAFDFSLNLISLLALSLVIGVLVDDAIVEVENIIRHLDMGKTPYEAAMQAADEIGLAVVATTFTLIAVFLPTAFMNGVVGQFFSQFGWTASIAIFISLLVARLATPMMSAYLLKPQKIVHNPPSKFMISYLSLVKWTLTNRTLTLVITVVFFVLSLSLTKLLPTGFIPDNDIDQTQVTLQMTPDATIDDTNAIAQQATVAIGRIDGVKSVFLSVGTAGQSMDSRSSSIGTPNIASFNVSLLPRNERPTKTVIENNIRQALATIPSARFKTGLSSGGESGYSFSLVGQGKLLNDTADSVMRELSKHSDISVTSNKPLPKPEMQIIPKTLSMSERKVTTLDLADTLRIATTGDYEGRLAKLNLDTRQLPIVVRLTDDAKQSTDTLKSLYVPSMDKPVKIGEIANLVMATGDSEIIRLDRERAIKITADSAMPLGELIDKVKQSPTLTHLPNGIRIIEEGQAESMNELFGGFIVAMSVGILCIFGVLVLLFERILQPFTILMALPLSIGGAFIGLLITNSSLSMPSMIGFIMLMGIATKNSILLVDYAVIAQNQGKQQMPAIIDACQKRARPIIMTTIAMGAGMLPLVLGLGGADPTFRRPMAAAVLGGLITSTFLSLVVVPVVYTLMDDLGNFFNTKTKLN